MKKLLTIICSLLICLTASAADYKFDKTDMICVSGPLRYGSEFRLWAGEGEHVPWVECGFLYNKRDNLFFLAIATEETAFLTVPAKFTDISVNIDPENNQIRGLEVNYNGNIYRIFKADKSQIEIRSENDGQTFMLDPTTASTFNLEDPETKTNFLSGYLDNSRVCDFYNHWIDYICGQVQK
ncbi:MAG: hypothetical protein J1E97_06205 [Muribaculaceae bacterium]|nr:hypothetical protein [Muribaculaceae bacterium]